MGTVARGLVGLLLALALVATSIAVATWGLRATDSRGDDRTDGPTTDATALAGASGSPPSGPGWVAWGARADGSPLRWDPCRPIDWIVRPDDPAWLVDVATEALDRVGSTAGVSFRYGGRHDVPVGADLQTAGDDGWHPVVVTLVDHDEVDWLSTQDRALAVPVLVDDVFVTGQVLLDADADLDRDFGGRRHSWGATLLHESGHLVGLDHVDDPDQLMYPYPLEGPAALSAGDRRGLVALAADPSCLDAGPVRDLPVRLHRPGS